MSEPLGELEYHGHRIRSGYNGWEPGSSSHSCFVYKADSHQFTVVVRMSVIISMTEYKGRDEERKSLLRTTAISHCEARIDLGRYEPEAIYEVLIGEPRQPTDPSEIPGRLLEAFTNVRELCPRDYRRQGVSLEGMRTFLNVSDDDIGRALNDLLDQGAIQTEGDPTESLFRGLAWISPLPPTALSNVPNSPSVEFEYDVALSFAGEQRPLAEEIADRLKSEGIDVFYDGFEKARLWGMNLYDHLHEVYSKRARHCLLIASAEYASKVWTNHER